MTATLSTTILPRGQGVANAYAGMEMGVDRFDASVAGLGGCPFAKLKGAAGNVCFAILDRRAIVHGNDHEREQVD